MAVEAASSAHLPLLLEPRDLVVHHVLIDSSHREAVDTNYDYHAYMGREGILKNVVSINLLSAVVPHRDNNVRTDANTIHLYEYYANEGNLERRVSATVAPGFYATVANFMLALRAALFNAVRDPPLASANDRPQYEVLLLENSHARIRVSPGASGAAISVMPLFDDDRRSVLYKLGYDARHPNFDAEAPALHATSAWISNRLVDISSTDYVDIDIPDLPSAGLKMTTQNRRIFARIPMTRNLDRNVHDLTERHVLRRHFHPINLEKVRIQLFDQYGQHFENNGADHSIDLEVICLAAPPPMPAVEPTHITAQVELVEATPKENELVIKEVDDAPLQQPLISVSGKRAVIKIAGASVGALGTAWYLKRKVKRAFAPKKPAYPAYAYASQVWN